MCGIAGFWNRGRKKADKNILSLMMDSIKHRGPDDSGQKIHQDIALGSLRLSIIDLSEFGHQPMCTKDEKSTLIYNGEVYNFNSIKETLRKKNICFDGWSDTEVVLKSLYYYGPEQAVKMFNGIFSFAYFNHQDEVLWLGRDRHGVKPLYLAEYDNGVAFSSEIKSLLQHPKIHAEPNVLHLGSRLNNGKRLELKNEETSFIGIKELYPGTLYKITREDIQKVTFFDEFENFMQHGIDSHINKTYEDHVVELRHKLKNGIELQLMSDVPISTSLSGGLDSGIVSAYAKNKINNLVAYTSDSYGASYSEYPNAKLMSNELGIKLNKVALKDDLESINLTAKAVWMMDEPIMFGNSIQLLRMTQEISSHGYKVLLTGDGADELFGGYSWSSKVYQKMQTRPGKFSLTDKVLNKIIGLCSRNLKGGKTPFDNDITAFDNLSNSYRRSELISKNILEGLSSQNRNYYFKRLLEKLPAHEAAFMATNFYQLRGTLKALLHKSDRMGMSSSLEVRVPFLDNNLVTHALSIPVSSKYSKHVNKSILRQASKNVLSDSAINLSKNKYAMGYNQHIFKKIILLLEDGVMCEIYKWDKRYQSKLFNSLCAEPKLLMAILYQEMWGLLYIDGLSQTNLTDKLLEVYSSK